jgi:uncharacterized protein YdeI (YjbR/CyaY-like superfamily)
MGTKDARIDAYIAKAQPFAQPILKKLRTLVHKAVPQVEETMKWSFPHFDYKGEMMCSMAAFKQHAAFGFWKAKLMKEAASLGANQQEAMGHLGRITSLQDLPKDAVLVKWIKEAARLNDAGAKVVRYPAKTRAPLKVPRYIAAALKTSPRASATWAAFSPSHKREYVEWIAEAKTEETRQRRIATALEWLAAGKSRNWKYER